MNRKIGHDSHLQADSKYKKVNLEYYLYRYPARADYWRRMAAPRFRVSTFLNILSDYDLKNLVDLGCGSGELLNEIRTAYGDARLCGIDLSITQISENMMRDPSIDWRVFDLDKKQDFPLALRNNFDVVMASEIIEHVDDPIIFLKNAAMLARAKSGIIILSTQSGRMWETERRVGHRRHFSAAEIGDMLSGSGWDPLKIWNTGFPFHDLSKRIANISPESTMRNFSEKRYGFFQKSVCAMLKFAYRFNSSRRGAQLFAIAKSSC